MFSTKITVGITFIFLAIADFGSALPTPERENQYRRGGGGSTYNRQEPTGQTNRLNENSQEGLVFSSGEVFTMRHNETRQSRLVLEERLRNGNSSQLTNGTAGRGQLRICGLEPSYLCLLEPVQSQRNKEMRILAIKDMVLSQLGRLNKAPTELSRINPTEALTRFAGEVPSSPFSGELQTFHASCELPNKVGVEAWEMPGFFHLFFNVSSEIAGSNNASLQQSRNSKGTNTTPENYPAGSGRQSRKPVNIISAKLRLYRIGSRATNDTEAAVEIPKEDELVSPQSTKNPASADERIRVSVYWYTMPATRHHYKKKLLDAKMISLKDTVWVDFDIQRAVKVWLDKKLNYGLSVEVENEDNDLVDAKNYFAQTQCTSPTAAPVQENSSQNLDSIPEPQPSTLNFAAPVLEICTLSVANNLPNLETDRPTAAGYPPFPFPVASRTFHRYYSDPRSTGGLPEGWAADQPAEPETHHRHRHHHGQGQTSFEIRKRQSSNSARRVENTQNSQIETATDTNTENEHPFKAIFAHPFRKNSYGQSHHSRSRHYSATRTGSDDLDSSSSQETRDPSIVIENMYIESQGSLRTR